MTLYALPAASPNSPAALRRALAVINTAQQELAGIADTALAWAGELSGLSEARLGLIDLSMRLGGLLREAPEVTRGEHAAALLQAQLAAFVRHHTGRWHDRNVGELRLVCLGGPDTNPANARERWRLGRKNRRHVQLAAEIYRMRVQTAPWDDSAPE